jgi:hypothetical protein
MGSVLAVWLRAVYLKLNSKKKHITYQLKEDFNKKNITEVHHVEIKQQSKNI